MHSSLISTTQASISIPTYQLPASPTYTQTHTHTHTHNSFHVYIAFKDTEISINAEYMYTSSTLHRQVHTISLPFTSLPTPTTHLRAPQSKLHYTPLLFLSLPLQLPLATSQNQSRHYGGKWIMPAMSKMMSCHCLFKKKNVVRLLAHFVTCQRWLGKGMFAVYLFCQLK